MRLNHQSNGVEKMREIREFLAKIAPPVAAKPQQPVLRSVSAAINRRLQMRSDCGDQGSPAS